MGRPAAGISRDAREWMLAYAWPGNARELRNAIERAILLCDGGLITRAHLPADALHKGVASSPALLVSANGAAPTNGAAAPLMDDLTLDVVERDLVIKALEQTKGNKSKAARLLGLTRARLYWRLEKYGLD
jgi:two-component system response regulator HydG